LDVHYSCKNLVVVAGFKEEQWLIRAFAEKCIIGKILEDAGGFTIMHGCHLQVGAMRSRGDASLMGKTQRKSKSSLKILPSIHKSFDCMILYAKLLFINLPYLGIPMMQARFETFGSWVFVSYG